MKLLLFIDGYVGEKVYSYLIKEHPEDIGMVVLAEDSTLEEKIKKDNIKYVKNNYPNIGELLKESDFELGLSVWWPYLIDEQVLNVPTSGIINFHPSLLPLNRGKNYNFWAIVEECAFGVTLHFLDEGIDTGDIIFQKELAYDWADTGESLFYRARDAMIDLFIKNYSKIRVGDYIRQKQELRIGSYHNSSELDPASKIELDKKYTARELLNVIRARTFDGYPGCSFVVGQEEYEIKIKIEMKNK